MTVSSQTNNETFYGNGVTTIWDLPFRFFNNTDIQAYLINTATEATTPLVLGTDYTLTGAGLPEQFGTAPGKITTTVPVATGIGLYVERVMDVEQTTDIVNQGRFFSEVHEDVFDRLTMFIQQAFSGLKNALQLDKTGSFWDFKGRRGVNAADPVNAQDVATKNWVGAFVDSVSGLINTTLGIAYDAGTLFDYLRFGVDRTVDTIAALRALASFRNQRARVIGYYAKWDGGGGVYAVDPADTTSADNGGTIIVAADGARWKMVVMGGEITGKQFGAKGDNTTDDYAKLQAWLDYGGSNRGVNLTLTSGKYKISAPLIWRPTVALPAAGAGSDIHFSDHVESVISNRGDARLVASAVMQQMLLLQFNSGLGSIGPFYTTVQGLGFDGAGLAVDGIASDYTMNTSLLKNKIRGITNGIRFTGYGVSKIRDNVIKASANCVSLSGGGGDSIVESNDFYPLAGAVGVRVGALGGNCSIRGRNVFNGEGFAGCIGVFLDGVGAGPANSVINVGVLDNEFSGMSISIYGQRHASARNVFGITVSGNHTIPAAGGAVHAGNLISFNGIDDAIIGENFVNGVSLSGTIVTTAGMQLVDCRRPIIKYNKFGNLMGPAAYFTTTIDGEFTHNEIVNTGMAGAGGVVVDVDTGTSNMSFNENRILQTSASYAQNPFYERAGANNNEFLRNKIQGTARITRVGAASVVAGRTIATGSYSLSGATATLQNNSHGFTVVRNAVGVCTVTLATTQSDSDFRIKVTADAPQVGADTFTANSFVLRTFTATGVAVDAIRVQIEVTN